MSIGFSDPGLYAESFEKISLKKSNIQEACQTLKIINVATLMKKLTEV